MKNWIFFFLLLGCTIAFGQKHSGVDRLQKFADEASTDSIKAILLHNIGIELYEQSSYDSALYYFEQGLPFALAIPDSALWVKLRSNIGLVHLQQEHYEKALKHFFKVLALDGKYAPNSATQSRISIANTFLKLRQKEKALAYANLGLQKAKEANVDKQIAEANAVVGSILNSLHRFNEASPFLLQSLKIYSAQKDTIGSILAIHNLSKVHTSNKKYQKAFSLLDSAFVLASLVNNSKQKGIIMTTQGEVHSVLKQYTEAIQLFEKAHAFAKTNGSLYQQMYLTERLAVQSAKIKRYTNASSYYKVHTELKDSLYRIGIKASIAESRAIQHTQNIAQEKLIEERKNAELQKANLIKDLKLLEEQSTNKNLILWGCVGFGLLCVAMLIYYLDAKTKKSKSKGREEKLRFQAVLEAEEEERARIAKDLHDGLGQLLSTAKLNLSSLEEEVEQEDKVLIQNSMHLIDEAVKEIRSISHNMMPAALMEYGLVSAINSFANAINETKALQVKFNHHGMKIRLEENKEIALYRVVQEVLNNCIKYANATEIFVSLNHINEKILLNLSDNGKGFDVNALPQSKGIGWSNIFSRISMINGTIEVNSASGEGTEIRIEIML